MIANLLLNTRIMNNVDDIYKNIKEYSLNKERKIFIIFDDMIADILSNKKLNSVVTELSIRGRKLNISFVFTTSRSKENDKTD